MSGVYPVVPVTYVLNEGTPDESRVTLAEFLEVNARGREREDFVEIGNAVLSLKVGETYEGGGGAQPVWTIRRVT